MRNFGAKNVIQKSSNIQIDDDKHTSFLDEKILPNKLAIINHDFETRSINSSDDDSTKAIYSKKYIENPIFDDKYFYQNKKVILYKTEMCRSFTELGFCKYGDRCQFCHSKEELRNVKRHPKYKTEICKTFWCEGSCPYGSRCCFVHLENLSLSGSKNITNSNNNIDNNGNSDINGTSDISNAVSNNICNTVTNDICNKVSNNNSNIVSNNSNIIDKSNINISNIMIDSLNNHSNSLINDNNIDKNMSDNNIDTIACTNSFVSTTHANNKSINKNNQVPDLTVRLFSNINTNNIIADKLIINEIKNKSDSENFIRNFERIFIFEPAVFKTAKKLEIDYEIDLEIESEKSIDDVKIERKDVWSNNYMKIWGDDPILFIFNNKYDKM